MWPGLYIPVLCICERSEGTLKSFNKSSILMAHAASNAFSASLVQTHLISLAGIGSNSTLTIGK